MKIQLLVSVKDALFSSIRLLPNSHNGGGWRRMVVVFRKNSLH